MALDDETRQGFDQLASLMKNSSGAMESIVKTVDSHAKELQSLSDSMNGRFDSVVAAFKTLVGIIEDQHNAINELKKRLGDDDLPPFKIPEFSIN